LKLLNKDKSKVKVVVNGAGAGGVATLKLLHRYGIKNIVVCDSKGIVSKDRKDLNSTKVDLLKITNKDNLKGSLSDALVGCDIFIGLSKGNLLGKKEIDLMNKDPVVFALANPTPEISPPLAKKLGVKIIGTGRSDYPNQINNSLVFPGIFKGAIDYRAKSITEEMKIGAAIALAKLVKKPTFDKVIPGPFDKGVLEAVSKSVKKYVK
jgi:malate dehydrogenase (oxaloacetate-decarboxylating)